MNDIAEYHPEVVSRGEGKRRDMAGAVTMADGDHFQGRLGALLQTNNRRDAVRIRSMVFGILAAVAGGTGMSVVRTIAEEKAVPPDLAFGIYRVVEDEGIPATDTFRISDDEGKERLKHAHEVHQSAMREIYLQERYFRNVEFHLSLASLSNKSLQIRFLKNSFDLLLLKYGGDSSSSESIVMVDGEHQKIYESVISGDVEGTQSILFNHIVNVKNQTLNRFKKVFEKREVPDF